ncbi:MAG TPA: hypothetical protein VJ624_09155 [Thermodesulfobacteriota bacterium]|nr:hypothetical protein [Thermodesulfobacteriota bacterium]
MTNILNNAKKGENILVNSMVKGDKTHAKEKREKTGKEKICQDAPNQT